MADEPTNQYYSYSQLAKYRQCERKFRTIQALLLLFMVICFIFCMITFGIHIAQLIDDPPLLAAALVIIIFAMLFLVFGIRGVAFESFCMVLTFILSFLLVIIAHSISFLFCHPVLTAVNLASAILLFLGAIIYICYLCRINRLKPPNYTTSNQNEDIESTIALTNDNKNVDFGTDEDPKNITKVKSNLNSDNQNIRIKRDLEKVKSGEKESEKREFENLQSAPKNIEKEFVAVKRVLLNDGQKGLSDIKEDIKKEYGYIQRDINEKIKSGLSDIKKEFSVVKKEISDNVENIKDDIKGRFNDFDQELSTSYKSSLNEIEKEFNIFQREFGGGSNYDNVEKVTRTVRRNIEEFKSGGENVRREILEVKRDESGNITSYVERRLTDSGVEISAVNIDKERVPIANFTSQ